MALPLDGAGHAHAGSGSSIAASLTTTQANDLIVVIVTGNYTNSFAGAAISSIASPNTTGWVQRVDTVASDSNNHHLSEWWGKATAPLSSESITVTFSAASGGVGNFITIDIFAIAGTIGPGTEDSNSSVPSWLNTLGGTPSLTTSNAFDVLIGAMRMGSTASPTAGSGWTLISGADNQLVEYQVVKSTGTTSVTVGGGASDQNAELIDAIVLSNSDQSARSICSSA